MMIRQSKVRSILVTQVLIKDPGDAQYTSISKNKKDALYYH